MKERRPDPRQELHKTVAAWLAVMIPKPPLGPFVCAIDPAPAKAAKPRALRRVLGAKPGMPEILLVWQGRPIFIALSPPGGVPDMQRRLRVLEIGQSGGAVVLCAALADVIDFVRRAGIPTVAADAYRKVVA